MPGKASIRIVATLAVVAAILLLGPRTTVDTTSRSLPPLPDSLPALENWMQQSEAAFGDVVQGTEKTIIWADPASRKKTDYVLIYLHGLSASRQEIAPVPQKVADHLQANLYLPRIQGHGRGSAPLGTSTANQWIDSAWEAWHIARQLGEKVIVIGTSTGATLTAWLLQQQGVPEHIHSLIFISPNFGLRDSASEVLTYPWAETWVPWVLGSEYAWEPANDQQAKYWTTRYSVKALHQLQALVEWAGQQDYSQTDIPTLFIYSDDDRVVNPDKTREVFTQWGGRKEHMAIGPVEVSSNHVIVGDILASHNNAVVIDRINAFIDNVDSSDAKVVQEKSH